MKKILFFFLCFLCLIAIIYLYSNLDNITPQARKAKQMVEKGVSYMEKNGTTKEKEAEILKEFSDTKGKFVDGNFYLFVYDLKGVCIAHGADNSLIGKDLINKQDSDGVMLIKDMRDGAVKNGSGWLNFKWPHPKTKKIQSKRSYYKRPKNKDMFIGCGFYR